jgi:hypothetical protein
MSNEQPVNQNGSLPATAKIHFAYIFAILIAIIVVLVTVKWSDIPTLANYLNFALGVASLVLAVLAIVYAFLANNSFNLTVAKLESSATAIKEETSNLEKAVMGLESKLSEIPEALHTLEGKVAKTHDLVAASSQQSKSEIVVDNKTEFAKELAHKLVDDFLRNTSWNGLKVLYLCKLACQKQKEFDLKAWTALDQATTYDYAFGFLVAASSMGLFQHKMKDPNGTIFSIISMPVPIAEKIHPAIETRIKALAMPYNTTWPPQIGIIEKFVG